MSPASRLSPGLLPFQQGGLDSLCGLYSIINAERIIKDAEVRFEVREGRMHHEGLRLGLPDIAPALVFTSSGSVGLDHSLDLLLEAPRIALPGKKTPADANSTAPVRLRVTGTIEKPVVTEIK
jgi:hypothetical protein